MQSDYVYPRYSRLVFKRKAFLNLFYFPLLKAFIVIVNDCALPFLNSFFTYMNKSPRWESSLFLIFFNKSWHIYSPLTPSNMADNSWRAMRSFGEPEIWAKDVSFIVRVIRRGRQKLFFMPKDLCEWPAEKFESFFSNKEPTHQDRYCRYQHTQKRPRLKNFLE